MNLFIDTNILLSFYHFTADDLEELNKLSVLLRKKEVTLFLPQQVAQEFSRNRDNKIADAIKRLSEQKLSLQFPQFYKDYPEFEKLQKLAKKYSKLHADLMKKVDGDISSGKLKADEIIKALLEQAVDIQTTDEILTRARSRVELGTPPGKVGSLGDAVNWEALLSTAPYRENLYFISDDKDYASPLAHSIFNAFLSAEWSDQKDSELVFYRSLSEFFKEHFPKIKLASELEKNLLIRDLSDSSSFAETHAIIASLRTFSGFTAAEATAIVDAATSNTQVLWIIQDPDVKRFLTNVIKGKEKQIGRSEIKELKEALERDDDED